MRKMLLLGALVLLASAPAMAQETPKAEWFTGYSYTRDSGVNFNGWNTSVNGNFNDWFGLKADFSGHYGSGVHLYSYTFGPQFSHRKNEKVVPFAHMLFGGANVGGGGVSVNGFAMNFGGGLDWVASKSVAVRVIQVDALVIRIGGSTSTDPRISFGITFRLGSK